MTNTIEQIKELPVGGQASVKFHLSSKDIIRTGLDEYEIHSTVGIWVSAILDLSQLEDCIRDPQKIFDLDWQ